MINSLAFFCYAAVPAALVAACVLLRMVRDRQTEIDDSRGD